MRIYYALNGGIGYDMNTLGAISIDMTHASSQLEHQTLKGESYRFNYSKVFDSIDSQITFGRLPLLREKLSLVG
ncbi:Outer membrane usher protein papC precursor [Serratia fonticola]|uniref:Outer membrane usher protein papC n=1 Tax=Serratia fonticola TaxID=47917 RepID=A0A4U9UAT3_SERFO|nr:Outer membrane usher protein papC precursor [Serratia fonticola]